MTNSQALDQNIERLERCEPLLIGTSALGSVLVIARWFVLVVGFPGERWVTVACC